MTDAHDHERERQPGRGPGSGAESGAASGARPSLDAFDAPAADAREQAAEAELRRALAARYGDQPFVPPAVHEAVLAEARAHFRQVRRRRTRGRWWAAGTSAAAAAALAVGVWVADPFGFEVAGPESAAALRGDVNGDGVVDVLDMLVLAKRLEQGAELSVHADITGDGRVTQRDVDALGTQIVALMADEEPRS